MLQGFMNKRVTVWVAFANYTADTAYPEKIKGTFTGWDDEFILIDNSILISRKYLIKIQLA